MRYGVRTRTVTVSHPKLTNGVKVKVTLAPNGETAFHRPVRRVTKGVGKMGWAKTCWFRYTEQAKTSAQAIYFPELAEAVAEAIEEMTTEHDQAVQARQDAVQAAARQLVEG